MADIDVIGLTAERAMGLLRAGECTSEELAQADLERIAAGDGDGDAEGAGDGDGDVDVDGDAPGAEEEGCPGLRETTPCPDTAAAGRGSGSGEEVAQ